MYKIKPEGAFRVKLKYFAEKLKSVDRYGKKVELTYKGNTAYNTLIGRFGSISLYVGM